MQLALHSSHNAGCGNCKHFADCSIACNMSLRFLGRSTDCLGRSTDCLVAAPATEQINPQKQIALEI